MDFVARILMKAARRSPWIIHLDTGGCNGCDVELFSLLSARYDVERFGTLEKGNPRQGDILVVTGAVNRKIAPRLKRIYDQMPHPKAVLAIGTCTASCGVFRGSYNIVGPLHKHIPVDVYVHGCPPKPEAIIDGLLKAVEIWSSRFGKEHENMRVRDRASG